MYERDFGSQAETDAFAVSPSWPTKAELAADRE